MHSQDHFPLELKLMTKEYAIEGMTCQGCVASVQQALEGLDQVEKATVQLSPPQAKINLTEDININQLQKAIGKYKIKAIQPAPLVEKAIEPLPDKSLQTYFPLLLIIAFITGVSLLSQYPFKDFSFMLWMRHFMAGFFLVFAFFKLLNIEGFASSYQMYDIIAARWKGWAYLYPFVELGLGILYMTNIVPLIANWITVVVLGISSIGVIQSVFNKRKIKCACLGDVFNLPMSTVTIIEDLTMVAMAAVMLFQV